MNCEETRELLTQYLLGDLAAEQMAEIKAHLQDCEGCRAAADEIEPTLDLLRDALAADTLAPVRLPESHRAKIRRSLPELARIFDGKARGKRRESSLSWFLRPQVNFVRLAAVIVVVATIMGAMMLPAVSTVRERARRTSSMNRLSQIGKAVAMYEMDHGRRPHSLDELNDYVGNEKVFQNAESGERVEYFAGAGSGKLPDDQPVAISRTEGGADVLYGDGSVKWHNDRDIRRDLVRGLQSESGDGSEGGSKRKGAEAKQPSAWGRLFKKSKRPAVAVQIMAPEPIEELEEIEEIIEEPPDQVGKEFTPSEDVGPMMDDLTGTPGLTVGPRPDALDSVAIVKSPMIMRGIHGSRGQGSRVGGKSDDWSDKEISVALKSQAEESSERRMVREQVQSMRSSKPQPRDAQARQRKPMRSLRGSARADLANDLTGTDSLDRNRRQRDRGMIKTDETGIRFQKNEGAVVALREKNGWVETAAGKDTKKAPKKKGFLSGLFGGRSDELAASTASDRIAPVASAKPRMMTKSFDVQPSIGDRIAEDDFEGGGNSFVAMGGSVADESRPKAKLKRVPAAAREGDVDGDFLYENMTFGAYTSKDKKRPARKNVTGKTAEEDDPFAIDEESGGDFIAMESGNAVDDTELAGLLADLGARSVDDSFITYVPKSGKLIVAGKKEDKEDRADVNGPMGVADNESDAVELFIEEELVEEALGVDEDEDDLSGPRFKAVGVNPFVATKQQAFSTFAIDVDTASYTLARNYMLGGKLPPAEAVRTEEFVNFFDYAYKPPTRSTFRIDAQIAPSKFGRGMHMLKIGVKGRRLGREEKRKAMLTFVIDASGSMNTLDRLGLVKKSLAMLVRNLGPKDRVAIVQFGSHARIVLEHTEAQNKEVILQVIDRLQTSGSTNLEEAMRLGYQVAERGFVGGAANRVLVMSDGAANLGANAAEEILADVEKYKKQGIQCSVFGFGIGTYNDEMLETLANKGDGAYSFIDSEDEAKRLFVDDLGATLNTIASDVKIQVEFNQDRVKKYRQLGYENRQLKKEQFRDDTVDAGEVGSGQSVTALYELQMAGDRRQGAGVRSQGLEGTSNAQRPTPNIQVGWERRDAVIATVRVRYRRVDTGAIEEIEHLVRESEIINSFENADSKFKLAIAVAELAEMLRGSPYAGSDYEDVARLLRPIALELSLDKRVQELSRLVGGAGGMSRGSEQH